MISLNSNIPLVSMIELDKNNMNLHSVAHHCPKITSSISVIFKLAYISPPRKGPISRKKFTYLTHYNFGYHIRIQIPDTYLQRLGIASFISYILCTLLCTQTRTTEA